MRFGDALENGVRYQLAGTDQYTGRFRELSYIPPGLWFYWASPPRPAVIFPFIRLEPSPIGYPGALPVQYQPIQSTGGLIPTAPIVIFLVALPWIWRRRSNTLGPLALPLLLLAGAGMVCVLFVAYEFFSTTERYEVDFTTLFLLGALAAWLALSKDVRGRRRRLARLGGGVLACWGCVAGFAISLTGYRNQLAIRQPGIWKSLADIGSPVSTVLASIEGHPVLAEITGPNAPQPSVAEQVGITVVSPDARKAVLLANLVPAVKIGGVTERGNYDSRVLIHGPEHTRSIYRVRPGGPAVRFPLQLRSGLNRLTLVPLGTQAPRGRLTIPTSSQLLIIESMSVAIPTAHGLAIVSKIEGNH